MKKLISKTLLVLFFLLVSFMETRAQTDECSGAPSITVLSSCGVAEATPWTVPSSFTISPEADPGCLSSGDNAIARDGWMQFTGTGNNTSIVVRHDNRQMGFAVYSGSCGSLSLEACEDAFSGQVAESTNIPTVNGTVYYVRIIRTNNPSSTNDMGGSICVFEDNGTVSSNEAADECPDAPVICSIDNYTGNTYDYTTDAGADNILTQPNFCGSIENNSWLKFVAASASVEFDVDVTNCTEGTSPNSGAFAIQMALYEDAPCGTVNERESLEPAGGDNNGGGNGFNCYNHIPEGLNNRVDFTDLTPGDTYLLMIDGDAGDYCDYSFTPVSGIQTGGGAQVISSSSGTETICSGGSATLGAFLSDNSVNITAYNWNGGSVTDDTNPTISVSPTTTTTYTVEVWTDGPICGASYGVFDITITVEEAPSVAISYNPGCVSSSATIATETPSGGTYSITGGGTINASTGEITNLSDGATYNVTYNAPSGNSCPNVSTSVSYTVDLCDVLEACYNASTGQFEVTGGNAPYTWYEDQQVSTNNRTDCEACGYTWNNFLGCRNGFNSAPANCNTLVEVSTTSAYVSATTNQVVVEDANGDQVIFNTGSTSAGMICAGTCVAPVLNNPGPSSVCENGLYLFPTPSGSNLQNPTYYTGSGGTGTPYTAGQSITITGNLTLYLYDEDGSCSDEEMFTVTMIPTPVISIFTGPSCSPDLSTYALTVDVTGGILTSTAGTVLDNGGNNWTISGVPAGTDITLTLTDGSCVGTLPVSSPNCSCPIVNEPTNATSITECEQTPIQTLTATATVGAGESVVWYDAATGGSVVDPATWSTVGTVIYYAETEVDATGCTSATRVPVTLTIDESPNFTPGLVTSSTDCQNPLGSFEIDGLIAGESYTVNYNGSDVTLTADNAGTITVVNVSDGTYNNVTVTSIANSCPVSVTNFGAVIATPGLPSVTAGNDTTICIGEAITLTATASAGTTSWQSGVVDGVSFTPGVIGVIEYVVEADDNGCVARDTVEVTIAGLPTPGITRQRDTICFGDDLVLQGTGGVDYEWSTGETTQNITISPVDYTPYQLTVTDVNGCNADTAIFITVVDQPIIDIDVNGPISSCVGDAITLTAISNGDIVWQDGSTGNTYVADGSTSPIYASTTALCGNVVTDSVVFVSGSTPIVDAGPDGEIEAGESYGIDATITGDTIFVWTPSNDLSCVDCEDPIASPDSTIIYFVTATSADGCIAYDSVIVTVIPSDDIWWPNAISGTGDDCCFGFTTDAVLNDYYLRIYNRWGELMFESRDQTEFWDGTFRGKVVQTGVYTFVMDYVDVQGTAQTIGGNITVVR